MARQIYSVGRHWDPSRMTVRTSDTAKASGQMHPTMSFQACKFRIVHLGFSNLNQNWVVSQGRGQNQSTNHWKMFTILRFWKPRTQMRPNRGTFSTFLNLSQHDLISVWGKKTLKNCWKYSCGTNHENWKSYRTIETGVMSGPGSPVNKSVSLFSLARSQKGSFSFKCLQCGRPAPINQAPVYLSSNWLSWFMLFFLNADFCFSVSGINAMWKKPGSTLLLLIAWKGT